MPKLKVITPGLDKFRAIYRGRKARAAVALSRGYVKKSYRRPARFNNSWPRYKKNRRFANSISKFSETKLIPCESFNNVQPTPNAGVETTRVGFILQSVPTGWDPQLKNLGGIIVAPGVEGQQRVGNYVYYKKTHLTGRIDMTFTTTPKPPVQFRMVICKSRQSVMPAGRTELPGGSLFLKPDGARQGYLSTGSSAMVSLDYESAPLNKRDWVIYKDTRFILSHPMRPDSDGGNVGYSGKYPVRRNFTCNLNHYKKTRISAPPQNDPEDYDAHYLIYIFATSIGDAGAVADQWTVSTRATTSYVDN